MTSLRTLFERHHRRTLFWLTRKARARSTASTETLVTYAEDAVQDAWTAIVARGIGEGDRMPGLLMRVAWRAFLLAQARRSRRGTLDRAWGGSRPTAGGLASGAVVTPRWAAPAIALTPRQLEVWVLRERGLPLKSIAEAAGLIHEHAVSATLTKARAALARHAA